MPISKINTTSITDNSVTAGKITAGAVSSAKIADSAVNTAKIADSAVNSAKIGVDVIAAEDLAANSVTVSEISNGAVTSPKLAANIDIAGTLDVTGVTTLDDTLIVSGTSTLSNLDVKSNTNLLSNSDFTTNTTGWAASGSSLAIVSNQLQLTPNSGVNGFANQQVDNLVVGRRYTVSVAITVDAGALGRLYIGTSANGNQNVSSVNLGVGTHTFTFIATQTTHHFALVVGGGSGQVTRFDNAKLYESRDVAVSGIITSAGTTSNPELVTNGDFSNGATGWTAANSTLSVSNGQLTVADNGGYTQAYQAVSTVVGQTYELSVYQVSVTGQKSIVGLSTASPTGNTWGNMTSFSKPSADLPYTQVWKFKALATTTYIGLGTEGSNSGVFDNVSLKKVGLPDNELIKASDLKTEIASLGIEIDTSGRAINKNQPGFCVRGTGSQAYSTGAIIVPTTPVERFNTGDHFNAANGRFTAPIEGRYFLSLQLTAWFSSSGGNDGWQTELFINGVEFHEYFHGGGIVSGYEDFVNPQIIINLQAEDYVDWVMAGYGGSFNFQQQLFTGYLLG